MGWWLVRSQLLVDPALWASSTALRAAAPSQGKLVWFSLAALTISLVITPALPAEDAWEALVKGGHVALIRHGNAPPVSVETRPASGSTTARRNGTSTTKDAHRVRRWARPSAATACAWTGSSPHPCAAAWTRPP